MKKILLASLAIFSMAFWGCSEESSTNSTPKNLYPLTVGSYRVYDNYDLDSNGYRITSSVYRDSVVAVETTISLDGKTATKFATFTQENGVYGAAEYSFIAKEGDKVYMHSSSFAGFDVSELPIPLPIELPTNQWFLISDPNASSSWVVFTQDFDQDIPFPNLEGRFKGKLTISISKDEAKNLTVIGKSVASQAFKTEVKIAGTYTLTSVPLPFNVEFVLNNREYLADAMGPIKYKQDKADLLMYSSLTPNSKTTLYSRLGSEAELVAYVTK